MYNRLDRDQHATREQDRRLAEGAEVLGAAVTIRMLGVGRSSAQAHGEERQRGGDHVAA
jgi:hypothetical protein